MLKFFGTGGAFDDEINSSAYIHINKTIFIIDCGENTFQTIKKYIDIHSDIENVTIAITHMHMDHVGGLSTLSYYLYYIKKIKLKILASINLADDIENLMLITGNYNIVEFCYINSQYQYMVNNLKISFIKTVHDSRLTACYGILIKYNDNQIYFSGDSSKIPIIIKEKLSAKEIDYYYQDISLIDYPKNIHMSINTFKEEYGDKNDYTKVYFYHNSKYDGIKEINIKKLGDKNDY